MVRTRGGLKFHFWFVCCGSVLCLKRLLCVSMYSSNIDHGNLLTSASCTKCNLRINVDIKLNRCSLDVHIYRIVFTWTGSDYDITIFTPLAHLFLVLTNSWLSLSQSIPPLRRLSSDPLCNASGTGGRTAQGFMEGWKRAEMGAKRVLCEVAERRKWGTRMAANSAQRILSRGWPSQLTN